jgi:hypothetical protein
MATDKGKEPVQEEQNKSAHGHQFFNKKPEGEKEEGAPLLKYGKGNETSMLFSKHYTGRH